MSYQRDRRQRNKVVEARTDLILGGELTAEAYVVHFETQMRRIKLRRLLYISYVHFARACAPLAGHDSSGIW
jgi:hypothetical protein